MPPYPGYVDPSNFPLAALSLSQDLGRFVRFMRTLVNDQLAKPDLPELLEIPDKRSGMIALKRKYLDVVVAAKDRMVRRGDWKLSYQPLTGGALYRLFNVREDPGCERDIIEQHPDVAAGLRTLLGHRIQGAYRAL